MITTLLVILIIELICISPDQHLFQFGTVYQMILKLLAHIKYLKDNVKINFWNPIQLLWTVTYLIASIVLFNLHLSRTLCHNVLVAEDLFATQLSPLPKYPPPSTNTVCKFVIVFLKHLLLICSILKNTTLLTASQPPENLSLLGSSHSY